MKQLLILSLLLMPTSAKANFILGYLLGSMSNDSTSCSDSLWYKIDEKLLRSLNEGDKSLKIIAHGDNILEKLRDHYKDLRITISKTEQTDTYIFNLSTRATK